MHDEKPRARDLILVLGIILLAIVLTMPKGFAGLIARLGLDRKGAK